MTVAGVLVLAGSFWWLAIALWLVGIAVDPRPRRPARYTVRALARAAVLWAWLRFHVALDAALSWVRPIWCSLFHDVDSIHFSPHYRRHTCRTCGEMWFGTD